MGVSLGDNVLRAVHRALEASMATCDRHRVRSMSAEIGDLVCVRVTIESVDPPSVAYLRAKLLSRNEAVCRVYCLDVGCSTLVPATRVWPLSEINPDVALWRYPSVGPAATGKVQVVAAPTLASVERAAVVSLNHDGSLGVSLIRALESSGPDRATAGAADDEATDGDEAAAAAAAAAMKQISQSHAALCESLQRVAPYMPPVVEPAVGDFVLTLSAPDDQLTMWCRSLVMRVDPNHESVFVEHVDYGCMESVQRNENIRLLPPFLAAHEALAVVLYLGADAGSADPATAAAAAAAASVQLNDVCDFAIGAPLDKFGRMYAATLLPPAKYTSSLVEAHDQLAGTSDTSARDVTPWSTAFDHNAVSNASIANHQRLTASASAAAVTPEQDQPSRCETNETKTDGGQTETPYYSPDNMSYYSDMKGGADEAEAPDVSASAVDVLLAERSFGTWLRALIVRVVVHSYEGLYDELRVTLQLLRDHFDEQKSSIVDDIGDATIDVGDHDRTTAAAPEAVPSESRALELNSVVEAFVAAGVPTEKQVVFVKALGAPRHCDGLVPVAIRP